MFARNLGLFVFSLGLMAAQPSWADPATPPDTGDSLYTLVTPQPATRLGCWDGQFAGYDEVLGYSVLGHFFLRNPKTSEYIVLHPLKGAAKSYGEHASIADFRREVLDEPGFQEYVFQPDHVAAIRARIGALGDGQVYIPEPYPFLGGSGEPETYTKGDAWVFANVVANLGGLCDEK